MVRLSAAPHHASPPQRPLPELITLSKVQPDEEMPIASWIPANLKLKEAATMSTAGRALKPPINGEEKLPPPTGIIAVPPPSKSTIALGKKMSGHQLICRIEAIFNVVQEAAAGAHAGLDLPPLMHCGSSGD